MRRRGDPLDDFDSDLEWYFYKKYYWFWFDYGCILWKVYRSYLYIKNIDCLMKIDWYSVLKLKSKTKGILKMKKKYFVITS
jgi:hypothetical protein